ncbi:MAG TPA: hypothetical protein VMF58_16060 [Rhizomicrobium sp.]|nr:hypothetical protein [Rhizomicrobium sp.]
MQKDRRPPRLPDWPDDWPDRTTLTPKQRKRFYRLIADHKRIGAWPWQRPSWVAPGLLNDYRQWEDVRVELQGKLARRGEVVLVTRWVWERILRTCPDIRVLKHGRRGQRGKGSNIHYAFPYAHALANRLRMLGRQNNSLTLASLLNAVRGIGDWDCRAHWHSKSRFNCTVFNLTVKRLPKTPDGDEAKRSRLALILGFEGPEEGD